MLSLSRFTSIASLLGLVGLSPGCIVEDPAPGDTISLSSIVVPPSTTFSYDTGRGLALDLYLPAAMASDTPVILYAHAGGFVAGDRSAVPKIILRQVQRGYTVASLTYRLAARDGSRPTFPAAVQDMKRAVRWTKLHMQGLGVVSPRVIAAGGSAGGYLAAFTGMTPGDFEPDDLPAALRAFDSRVIGVVDIAGPTNLVTWAKSRHPWAVDSTAAFLGCPEPPQDSLDNTCADYPLIVASVTPWIDASDPPTYWAFGELDTLVAPRAQAAPAAQALADAKGSPYASWIDIVNGGGHNLDADTIHVRAFDGFLDALRAEQLR